MAERRARRRADRRPRRQAPSSARCTCRDALARRRSSSGPTATSCRRRSTSSRKALADTLEPITRRRRRRRVLFGADARGGPARRRRGADPRLRHELLRRHRSRATGSSRSRRCPATVEIASEYRYRDVGAEPAAAGRHHLAVGRDARHDGGAQARQGARPRRARSRSATCARARSRAPRGCVFYTRAGAEIGVASTKAFTTQLAALFTLTLVLAKLQGPARRRPTRRRTSRRCATCPGSVQHALNLEPQIRVWSERFAHKRARALPRPRHPLPDRARRRAQAQGDLLHPRRGLSRPAS